MSANEDRAEQYRTDPRPTNELISVALTKDADADDDEFWHPVRILQHRLPQILNRIMPMSESLEEKSRDTAATILGQCSVKEKFSADICAEVLLRMMGQEQSPDVLTSVVFALGHLDDPRVVEPLARLQSHPDPRVRYAVVSSLGGYTEEKAVATLIERSNDEDRDVRNWATFGLGSLIDTDTPEIRAALFARLEEQDDEIRGEAFVGLARRRDVSVVPALLKELESNEPHVLRNWLLFSEAIEAVVNHASNSGAKDWLPILNKLVALGIGDQVAVHAAIDRCSQSQQ